MPSKQISKYGRTWKLTDVEDSDVDLLIEMECIKKGGEWKEGDRDCGKGLSFHYEQMRRCLWPELDGDHNGQRWHTLIRNEVVGHKFTALMGSASSGKTHSAAWIFLAEYYCYPNETCVLISSTDLRGLELRVWGEIKSLHERAQLQFGRGIIKGTLIDSKHAISTDDLEEDGARDLRKGLIGIPCIQGGKFVGLGKYAGVKQKRVRLLADECQFMSESFLSAVANLDKNEDFKAVFCGNPNDILDPLGKVAEPKDGWATHMEPTKTECWDTRFMNGRCVNLIGTDSPNFDFPEIEPTRFKYLISREKIANTLSFFAKDSIEYYSQCVGSMKIGIMARRVLTRDLCRQFGAQEDVLWQGDGLTYIYFVDASYGGDRCVAGSASFGKDTAGKTVLNFNEPKIIPILVGTGKEPEYQIADYVKQDCESQGIQPANMGHDATGRGSLGTAIAQVWSSKTQPVESGGAPTQRPVCADLFIYDEKEKKQRLKRCDEHYDRRVTEYWFSVRYAVEASQVRNLPEEVMDELCTRRWDMTGNNKISVEVKNGTKTKPGMKQRTGKSPDLGDWAAGIVEMARRRGFLIAKLANNSIADANTSDWIRSLHKKQSEQRKNHELQEA